MKIGARFYYLYENLSGKFEFYIVEIEEEITTRHKGGFFRAKAIKRLSDKSSFPLVLGRVYTFPISTLYKFKAKKELIFAIFGG